MAYLNQYARKLLPVSTAIFDRLKRQGGIMPKSKPAKKTVQRSSVTGQFVTKKFAKTHPKTTETERVRTGN